jgi:hypothetical protein
MSNVFGLRISIPVWLFLIFLASRFHFSGDLKNYADSFLVLGVLTTVMLPYRYKNPILFNVLLGVLYLLFLAGLLYSS